METHPCTGPQTKQMSESLKKNSFISRAIDLYVDGFRKMTIGRSLWLIILIKLFIMFAILKVFFFPDLLSTNYDSDAERADAVRNSLINKNMNN